MGQVAGTATQDRRPITSDKPHRLSTTCAHPRWRYLAVGAVKRGLEARGVVPVDVAGPSWFCGGVV